LHATDPDAQAESGLTSHDHRLLLGALEYKHKRVADVMTGIDNCFMLEDTQRLNFATMLNIYRSGFTRIPVYHGDRRSVVGVLYAKDLILADPEDELEINTILSFRGRYEAQIAEDTLLDKALQQFLTSGRHMMLVHKAGWRPGPVTAAKIDATQTTRASFGALAVNGRPGSAPGLNGGAGGSQHGTASALPSLENQVLNAEVTGILTLEDVIEELLKTEILDETDQW
jgi:CBS domain containing-hemolysin-like protein